MWEPTVIVIVKRDGGLAVRTVIVHEDEGDQRALLVFHSRAEAQLSREVNDEFTGYGIVGVDAARIAGLLGRNGPRWVAMPETLAGEAGLTVRTFDGDRFLKLLEIGIEG